MASYRDWLNIDKPNELDIDELKQAIKTMGKVANTRLKRMANRKVTFGDLKGDDTTAGVKRFSVRGKNEQELYREFRRVRNFLLSPQSSLTGMKKAMRDFKSRFSDFSAKERREYRKMYRHRQTIGDFSYKFADEWEELRAWRKSWDLYNKLIANGDWRPSQYDSDQTRELAYAVASKMVQDNEIDFEKAYTILKEAMNDDYKRQQILNENDNDDEDISTSKFFAGGSD